MLAKRRFSFPALHNMNWVNRLLTGHYNVINQHQIISWTRMLLLSESWRKIFFQLSVLYNKRALTEQIVPVDLVSMCWITWWEKDFTTSHRHDGSRWYINWLGIFFFVKVVLVLLLHPFWNHWLSLQCDWFSAVRFIPKLHHFLL